MLSSTSDAIIFLFLGIVVVGDHHLWHTGFVLWTLFLCLICRFGGVFCLTAIANVFRVSPINLQEQFLMAYGGLRGAVAFSLVEMLDRETVRPRQMFVTTTLVVIFFTVFIQGSTIKPLVRLLHIRTASSAKKKMIEECNDNIISNMMAGVEEILGSRGDWYIRTKMIHLDEKYLQKIFLVEDAESELTRLDKKLALVEHFAHLYGPVALVEDHKTELFRNDSVRSDNNTQTITKLLRQESFRISEDDRSRSLPAGVELRRRNTFKNTATIDVTKADQLRKAFRNYPGRKFPSNIPEEREQTKEKLLHRQMTARCITVLVNRKSLPEEATSFRLDRRSLPSATADNNQLMERPRTLIRTELEQSFPEEVEGIDSILLRAGQRRQRSSTTSESDSLQSPFPTRHDAALDDIEETEMDVFLPNKNTNHTTVNL